MTETEITEEVGAGAVASAVVPLLVETILLDVTTVGLLFTPETDLHHVDENTHHPDVAVDRRTMIGGLDLIGQTTVIHERLTRFSIMAATRPLTTATQVTSTLSTPFAFTGPATAVLAQPSKALTKPSKGIVIASVTLQKPYKKEDTFVNEAPPKVKCRLPPIGAPTGPRSGRRVVEHPAYDPTLAAQFSPEEQPSVRPVEAEPLELGQLEPEIVVKDEPMDVEPAKPEEVVVSLPLASTSESTVVHHSSSPVRPSHKHRTPSPPSAMAIDEQIPDIRPPSPTKEEPVHQPVKIEVKAEPSIPTRPRRFFEDHPPVRVERSSPGPKSEGRQYGRDDRHSPAPSHLHIKDSPNSPRSPRLKTEDRFNEHSRRSSAMHTPSIPSQELTGSAAHSPRLPFDAPPLERASSEHKPSFMRMGPRTEHEHGRHPHPQRESTLRDKEKQAETLYSTTDVNDYKLKHQKRMQLERESQAMACQLYTDMQELSSALLDLQSAQARTKLAAAMSDLARAGKLGIDYPPNQVNMWDRADNAI